MKNLTEKIKEYEIFLQDNIKSAEDILRDKDETILGLAAYSKYLTKKKEYENCLNKFYELFSE